MWEPDRTTAWSGLERPLKLLQFPPPSLGQVAPSSIQRDPWDPTGEEEQDKHWDKHKCVSRGHRRWEVSPLLKHFSLLLQSHPQWKNWSFLSMTKSPSIPMGAAGTFGSLMVSDTAGGRDGSSRETTVCIPELLSSRQAVSSLFHYLPRDDYLWHLWIPGGRALWVITQFTFPNPAGKCYTCFLSTVCLEIKVKQLPYGSFMYQEWETNQKHNCLFLISLARQPLALVG